MPGKFTRSMRGRFVSGWALMVAGALLVLAAPRVVDARAKAESGSSSLSARTPTDTDSNTWRYSTPTAKDTITWTSGKNYTDLSTTHPELTYGPETKFGFPGAVFRTYTGFTRVDNGTGGSTCNTSGSGSGGPVPATIKGINHTANWTVTATGTLGVAPNVGHAWDS